MSLSMELKEHVPDMLDRLMDTTSKVYFLLNTYKLWDSEGKFTFPDGDIWEKEQHPLFWGNPEEGL